MMQDRTWLWFVATVVTESEKAIKLLIDDNEHWIPFKLLKAHDDDLYRGNTMRIALPVWLVVEKNIAVVEYG